MKIQHSWNLKRVVYIFFKKNALPNEMLPILFAQKWIPGKAVDGRNMLFSRLWFMVWVIKVKTVEWSVIPLFNIKSYSYFIQNKYRKYMEKLEANATHDLYSYGCFPEI